MRACGHLDHLPLQPSVQQTSRTRRKNHKKGGHDDADSDTSRHDDRSHRVDRPHRRGAGHGPDVDARTSAAHLHRKAIIADFEKANPDIKVQYDVISALEYSTKLLTAFAAGSGPDLFNNTSTLVTQYFAARILAPIDYDAFGYA